MTDVKTRKTKNGPARAIKEPSAAINRSRRKLEARWAEEAKQVTPERIQKVKELIAEKIARSADPRLPVPGKEHLSLFTPGKMKVVAKLSPKVEAVMKRVQEELKNMSVAAPVA